MLIEGQSRRDDHEGGGRDADGGVGAQPGRVTVNVALEANHRPEERREQDAGQDLERWHGQEPRAPESGPLAGTFP